MVIKIYSEEELDKVSKRIAEKIQPKSIVALYGDLGAGKTTFTRYFVKNLGSTARVQSPTFIIQRTYVTNNKDIQKIHHLDLYRLNRKEDLGDIDFEELFNDEKSVTVIEWPQIIEEMLPQKTIKIYFDSLEGEERTLDVQNID